MNQINETTYTRSLNGTFKLLALIGFPLVSLLFALSVYNAQEGKLGLFSWIALSALLLSCALMKVRLHVADDKLRIKVMRIFGTSIKIETIESLSEGPHTGFWEGAGVRFIGNTTAYVVGGPTIRIETPVANYLVSVENPQQVLSHIASRSTFTGRVVKSEE